MGDCKSWVIRGGRILDPVNGRNMGIGDLWIADGRVSPGSSSLPPCTGVVDASGLIVAPGLVDLHVHMREPGDEDSETVATASVAAARGGFTTVVIMPNTRPPLDSAIAIRAQINLAEKCGMVRVLPAGCITSGRKGGEVADLAAMAKAGAVAFTDDGTTVPGRRVMRDAMAQAAALGLPVLDHAQDHGLAADGVMHDGKFSRRLKLPGIPFEAETEIVKRDIELAGETGCAIHIQHVSAAETIPLLRDARGGGLAVSAEVTPHHLFFADEDVVAGNGLYKVNPPLRSRKDRDALRTAAAGSLFAAFATDHAPHALARKSRPMQEAPFGMVGLETAVGATYTTMVKSGLLPPETWLDMWTRGPCGVLGMAFHGLAAGAPADVVLLDLESGWMVDARKMVTKSPISPFEGCRLTGRVVCTFLNGRVTWEDGSGRVDMRG